MEIDEIVDQFTQLPSGGLHYKCNHCKSVFSDMSIFPDMVKIIMMKTHLEDCDEFINGTTNK